MSHLVTAAVLSAATGAVTFTTSSAKISMPARIRLARRARKGQPHAAAWKWLSDLAGCHFCSAVWLSAAATGIYRPWLVNLWRPLDFAVTALAMAGASTVTVAVIRASTRPVTQAPPAQPASPPATDAAEPPPWTGVLRQEVQRQVAVHETIAHRYPAPAESVTSWRRGDAP